ncbi:Histone acetyltransferase mst1 [Sphaceloma murrayae]|uniref:Histone acetyltransferase mst1 n=1 Tax=Sphaceloma murrayae TaxID=2082308 RepID=A0A2K1QPM3_9PEZI|nr:Histone acetyltransferase mst1 [Sphaceloma murrayae]
MTTRSDGDDASREGISSVSSDSEVPQPGSFAAKLSEMSDMLLDRSSSLRGQQKPFQSFQFFMSDIPQLKAQLKEFGNVVIGTSHALGLLKDVNAVKQNLQDAISKLDDPRTVKERTKMIVESLIKATLELMGSPAGEKLIDALKMLQALPPVAPARVERRLMVPPNPPARITDNTMYQPTKPEFHTWVKFIGHEPKPGVGYRMGSLQDMFIGCSQKLSEAMEQGLAQGRREIDYQEHLRRLEERVDTLSGTRAEQAQQLRDLRSELAKARNERDRLQMAYKERDRAAIEHHNILMDARAAWNDEKRKHEGVVARIDAARVSAQHQQEEALENVQTELNMWQGVAADANCRTPAAMRRFLDQQAEMFATHREQYVTLSRQHDRLQRQLQSSIGDRTNEHVRMRQMFARMMNDSETQQIGTVDMARLASKYRLLAVSRMRAISAHNDTIQRNNERIQQLLHDNQNERDSTAVARRQLDNAITAHRNAQAASQVINTQLTSHLSATNAFTTALQNQITTLETQLATQTQQAQTRQGHTSQLYDQLTSLQNQLDDLRAQGHTAAANHRIAIVELEARIEMGQIHLTQLRAQLQGTIVAGQRLIDQLRFGAQLLLRWLQGHLRAYRGKVRALRMLAYFRDQHLQTTVANHEAEMAVQQNNVDNVTRERDQLRVFMFFALHTMFMQYGQLSVLRKSKLMLRQKWKLAEGNAQRLLIQNQQLQTHRSTAVSELEIIKIELNHYQNKSRVAVEAWAQEKEDMIDLHTLYSDALAEIANLRTFAVNLQQLLTREKLDQARDHEATISEWNKLMTEVVLYDAVRVEENEDHTDISLPTIRPFLIYHGIHPGILQICSESTRTMTPSEPLMPLVDTFVSQDQEHNLDDLEADINEIPHVVDLVEMFLQLSSGAMSNMGALIRCNTHVLELVRRHDRSTGRVAMLISILAHVALHGNNDITLALATSAIASLVACHAVRERSEVQDLVKTGLLAGRNFEELSTISRFACAFLVHSVMDSQRARQVITNAMYDVVHAATSVFGALEASSRKFRSNDLVLRLDKPDALWLVVPCGEKEPVVLRKDESTGTTAVMVGAPALGVTLEVVTATWGRYTLEASRCTLKELTRLLMKHYRHLGVSGRSDLQARPHSVTFLKRPLDVFLKSDDDDDDDKATPGGADDRMDID